MLEANEKVNILQFLVSTRPSPSTLRRQVPLVLETGRVLGVESYSATYHQILCKFNYVIEVYGKVQYAPKTLSFMLLFKYFVKFFV